MTDYAIIDRGWDTKKRKDKFEIKFKGWKIPGMRTLKIASSQEDVISLYGLSGAFFE